MPDIEKELQEVTDLISLPEIYLKVRRLLEDEAADIEDFAEVVVVDPNLSARLLRVVNSAYYGFPEPVESLSRALNLVGLDQLHSMVLGVSAVSSLDLPNDILPLKPFWHGSLYCGVLTRLMADRLKLERSDRLFVAGLLHDIGSLVLCAKFPDHAREAIRLSVQTRQPVHEIQRQMLDHHYGDIGAMLMANWNLSRELQTLIRFQPEPETAPALQVETALVHFAHACTSASRPLDVDNLVAPGVRAMIDLAPDVINDFSETARAVSIEMGKAILH